MFDAVRLGSKLVKVNDGVYYSEVSCEGTVIYPGGVTDYKKQIALKLDLDKSGSKNRGLFPGLTGIFGQPIQITRICLYDDQELIWESN